MDERGRLDRFDKNLWLIGIACMHYLHEMVDAELTHTNDERAVKRPLKGKFQLYRIHSHWRALQCFFYLALIISFVAVLVSI